MGAALILLAVLSVALMVIRIQGQGMHQHAYAEPMKLFIGNFELPERSFSMKKSCFTEFPFYFQHRVHVELLCYK